MVMCTRKKCRCTADRISLLPDDILSSILSLLTIKEAAGTSVLSKRWMHLWKNFNGSISFDDSYKLLCGNVEVVKRERYKYVEWLNKVIDSHKGNSIDELCVWFYLDGRFSSDIDKWIKFAISKRVQRLTVALHRIVEPVRMYTLHAGCLEIPNRSFNMKFLTSLCFSFVSISGELLECFLCNCPLLEILSVAFSHSCGRLVVPSSAVHLKCLEIVCCRFDHVEVNAPNLVKLNYYNYKIPRIGNLSKLVDLTCRAGRHGGLMDKFSMFSSYFFQLEFLRLSMHRTWSEVNLKSIGHLHFPNLKHLTLQDFGCRDRNLLQWLSLIHYSPSLLKFTLELHSEAWYPSRECTDPTVRVSAALSHQCLKVVEVVGFKGEIGHLNLVMYLINTSIKLEKLVIDRLNPSFYPVEPIRVLKETKETRAAKASAMQLKEKLPSGAKLVVK